MEGGEKKWKERKGVKGRGGAASGRGGAGKSKGGRGTERGLE